MPRIETTSTGKKVLRNNDGTLAGSLSTAGPHAPVAPAPVAPAFDTAPAPEDAVTLLPAYAAREVLGSLTIRKGLEGTVADLRRWAENEDFKRLHSFWLDGGLNSHAAQEAGDHELADLLRRLRNAAYCQIDQDSLAHADYICPDYPDGVVDEDALWDEGCECDREPDFDIESYTEEILAEADALDERYYAAQGISMEEVAVMQALEEASWTKA